MEPHVFSQLLHTGLDASPEKEEQTELLPANTKETCPLVCPFFLAYPEEKRLSIHLGHAPLQAQYHKP